MQLKQEGFWVIWGPEDNVDNQFLFVDCEYTSLSPNQSGAETMHSATQTIAMVDFARPEPGFKGTG